MSGESHARSREKRRKQKRKRHEGEKETKKCFEGLSKKTRDYEGLNNKAINTKDDSKVTNRLSESTVFFFFFRKQNKMQGKTSFVMLNTPSRWKYLGPLCSSGHCHRK